MQLKNLAARARDAAWPWAIATLAAAALGALVNTQFNLAALQGLGVTIPFGERVATTAHDLYSFMPFLSLMVGLALAGALPVAAWLSTKVPSLWGLIYAAGGASGMAVAMWAANRFSPMPTVIACTRDWPGYVAILLVAALGATLYRWLTRDNGPVVARPATRRPVIQAGVIFAVLAVMHFSARALPDPPPRSTAFVDYEIETIADGLAHPWGLAFLPDGRLLVTERAGRLNIIDPSGSNAVEPVTGTPPVRGGGQGGLMDVRLSPQFASNRRIFLTHACGTSDANNTCVSRARLEGNALHGLQRILEATPMKHTDAQYGSRIAFLPDGTFVVSIGDGFEFREQAQNKANHLGKLVRLTEDGTAPDDNPFVDQPGVLPELYSYGHRNPQGLVYDSVSGLLYETEHGPRGGDEVNIIEAGADYGWPKTIFGVNYPGDKISPYTGLAAVEAPIHYWRPSIAPSGLAVYRGNMFPALAGDLLISALSDQSVYWLELSGRRVTRAHRLFTELQRRIRLVEVAPDGAIYLLTDHDPGQVLRVVASARD